MGVNRNTIRLYWAQSKKYKFSFFTMLIGIPLAALLIDTLLPYTLSQAIGTFANGNTEALWGILWIAAGVAIVGCTANLIGYQAAIRHESQVRRDLVNNTVNQLLIKDHEFFVNQKIGSLTGKLIDFVSAHVGLQDLIIARTLTFLLGVGSGVVIIFLHTPLLGMLILGLIGALILQIRLSLKIRMPYRTERKRLNSDINGAAADAISNSLTAKTFANEKHEYTILSRLTQRYSEIYRKDLRLLSIDGTLRIFEMSIVQIIAIAILATLLANGGVELGIAIFTIAYLQRVSTQLFSLGDLINGYDKLFLQAAPMTEILMSENAIQDIDNARRISVSRGNIKLDNITYSYSDDKDASVIKNLSATFESGEKVGLIGASGAGKSTITKLLLRFDDVREGAIVIDGQDIREVTQESLRSAIAYVPQEPALFHRTLRENIAYGKLNATDKEIEAAAQKANAIEFIDKLPHGLDTIVGERGVKLSGGQRQRIAIARAILKDAPILILDEATSALDSESEKLIQDALAKLMKGRTSIVIAHRLSTIAKLDRIIVLDNGKIAEEGTHAELISHGGIYAKLWAHQSGGFIDE